MTPDLVPASEQAAPGAEDEDLIITPGAPPPFILPWCASCGQMPELFTFDTTTSPLRMGIQATCHGKTEGRWVTIEDLFARKRLGQPVRMFEKAAFNRVR